MRRYVLWLLIVLLVAALCACSSAKSTHSRPPAGEIVNTKSGAVLSAKMGIDVSGVKNEKLIAILESWMGTPYRYGGNSKAGTDCSGLISQVFPAVYNLQVPRTSQSLYDASKPISTRELQEGDLVFFRINTKQIGHAGIFLCNGNFAHATTQRGVTVSNLSDAYWNKYFVGAGRISE